MMDMTSEEAKILRESKPFAHLVKHEDWLLQVKEIRAKYRNDSSGTLEEIYEYYNTDCPPKPLSELVSHLSSSIYLQNPPYSSNKHMENVFSHIAPSVVAVSSFCGIERRVDCSGLIISWDFGKQEGIVLTSARLLGRPDGECFTDLLIHIIARSVDGTLLLCSEEYVDYYHNILILKVKSSETLEAINLSLIQTMTYELVKGMNVIALSRSFVSCCFNDDVGELYFEYPYFGCEQLMRTTCRISSVGEGGPLVASDGSVVGINFVDANGFGHPLPIKVIFEILGMWQSGRSFVRPWFGVSVVDADQLPHYVWERYKKSPNELFVVVKEVYEGSPAYVNGVRPGDLVATCDGIMMNSTEEFSQLLLNRSWILSAGYDHFLPRRHFQHSKVLSKRTKTMIAGGDSDLARKSFTVIIQPSERSASNISVEAENVAVNDKRFHQCWPTDASWYNLKSGSKRDLVRVGPPCTTSRARYTYT